MRKILLIFGLLCVFVIVTKAQNCPFNVKFTVTDATCFNNGKIAYWLEDDDGVMILEGALQTKGLSMVRIYSKVNPTDSVHYSGNYYRGGVDTFLIDHGTYIIGVEGLCDDVYLIHKGRILLHEDTDRLLSEYGVLKVSEEDFEKLDQEHIISCKKENYGYLCFTDQKKYYMENYPQIIVENSGIDDMILLMSKGR